MKVFLPGHEYLSGIDLFSKDDTDGLKMSDLEFICPSDMYCGYNIGVTSEDPITASSLQARLIELGLNTFVEIVNNYIIESKIWKNWMIRWRV